jgi:hypothetical protein
LHNASEFGRNTKPMPDASLALGNLSVDISHTKSCNKGGGDERKRKNEERLKEN